MQRPVQQMLWPLAKVQPLPEQTALRLEQRQQPVEQMPWLWVRVHKPVELMPWLWVRVHKPVGPMPLLLETELLLGAVLLWFWVKMPVPMPFVLSYLVQVQAWVW